MPVTTQNTFEDACDPEDWEAYRCGGEVPKLTAEEMRVEYRKVLADISDEAARLGWTVSEFRAVVDALKAKGLGLDAEKALDLAGIALGAVMLSEDLGHTLESINRDR